jgi:hypothetical protein
MIARSLLRGTILAFALVGFSACSLCSSRDVREDVTLTVLVGQVCPGLDDARKSDPAVDSGPTLVEVWTARCCYDVTLDIGGTPQAAERCEEHDVHSDWDQKYLECPSSDYRASRTDVLTSDADAGTEAIVAVNGGPRETRTEKETQCVYSKVAGTTSADACG